MVLQNVSGVVPCYVSGLLIMPVFGLPGSE